jgi:hypothetical protein
MLFERCLPEKHGGRPSAAGRVGRGRLSGLLFGLLASACLFGQGCLGVPGGGGVPVGGVPASSGDDPRCVAYCRARQDKGCGGVESLCRLACNISFQVDMSEGKCARAAEVAEECRWSPAELDLGCSPPQDKVDQLCTAEKQAHEACIRERDGR